MNVTKESLPSFMAGSGTVGTTPAQLSALDFEVRKRIVIRADAGNASTIKVGTSSAQAANGFTLAAGEQTPPIYIDNTTKVWLVGGAADQGFSWLAT